MKKLNYLLFLFSFTLAFSQSEMNNIDLLNREKSRLIENYMEFDSEKDSYMIYILGDKSLAISLEEKGFHLTIFSTKKENNSILSIKKEGSEFIRSQNILKEYFSEKIEKKTMFSGNNYIGNSYVYFLFNKEDDRIIEFNLPSFTYTDDSRNFDYPVKIELLKFLTTTILDIDDKN